MESNIINALEDLRVSPTHLAAALKNGNDDANLSPILSDWTKYSSLISWVAVELKTLCSEVDEAVSPITPAAAQGQEGQCQPSLDDLSSFKMELSSLLKELGCPYTSLMESPLASRFENVEDRQILLNFLLSELEAARIIHVRKKGTSGGSGGGSSMNVTLKESPTAKILREICQELGLGKPPEGMSAEVVWAGILAKVKGRTGGGGNTLEPLFTGVLTQDQWTVLDNYFKELKSDYGMRREMLLKRLDVTVQSFHWSDRLKGEKEVKLRAEFDKLRPKMVEAPGVELADVLAARADLAIVEKTSSTSVRKNTRSAVNDVVIGKVPDRGGRPNEVEPPPPEMPSWQQRQGAPGSSGWIQRGGGGGGGDRGGGGGGRGRGGGANRGGDFRGGGNRGGDHRQYDNRGGNQGGDYRGGNQGGDYRGGNQGGDYRGGNQGGGYRQHDNRCDDFRGGNQNQGGDYRGGNQGGDYRQHDYRGGNQGEDYRQHDNRGGNQGRGRGGFQQGRGRVQGGWST